MLNTIKRDNKSTRVEGERSLKEVPRLNLDKSYANDANKRYNYQEASLLPKIIQTD